MTNVIYVLINLKLINNYFYHNVVLNIVYVNNVEYNTFYYIIINNVDYVNLIYNDF